MKLSREFTNGFIIFIGIGVYFLIMDYLGLSKHFYLRVLNVFIVVFGVNRTISQNYNAGVRGYNTNLVAAIITSLIGAVLSIAGLLTFIYFKGGENYLESLSEEFLFAGGNASIYTYCIGLLFESVAASLIVSFCLMQFWKTKVEKINSVN
ncbi:MAG: hypothetical protein CFE23_10160 [Flavobacterium sp. BFFFF1]|uniref:hypothetical protein n=1 Tax=Flavobacterium sp. BFFFF1 TaxID=2015557 RepID=UPI000BCEF288|nr:hypothetical protein [Flavobacterium sp. BFFFF1]OYU80260.1 MAG: hypothetical protein CFE23_10160 [Flavobacterium sp. BFFFF1]